MSFFRFTPEFAYDVIRQTIERRSHCTRETYIKVVRKVRPLSHDDEYMMGGNVLGVIKHEMQNHQRLTQLRTRVNVELDTRGISIW